jgi:hypothetical protein
MKKTRSKKSRDNVPLSSTCISLITNYTMSCSIPLVIFSRYGTMQLGNVKGISQQKGQHEFELLTEKSPKVLLLSNRKPCRLENFKTIAIPIY